MRRTMLVLCALLVTTTFGCERVRPELVTVREGWAGLTARIAALFARVTHKHPQPLVPVHPVALKPATPPPAPPPVAPPAPAAPALITRVGHDVPYVSQDTGTLTPGMSERDVYSLWGAPIAVRRAGEYTYLFFRNGCEHRCGTEDVVTLDNGQVVNAVVRWPGHNFLGGSPAPSAPPAPPLIPPPPPPGAVTDSLPVKGTVPSMPDTTPRPDSTHAPGGAR